MIDAEDSRPLLTVIVPVFNEVNTVARILRSVAAIPLELQIIVVDDGSTDGTQIELRNMSAELPMEMILHEQNRGKGSAVRSALNRAMGQFTVIQDADLEYDPREITSLIAPLREGRALVVYGSRYSGGRVGFSGRRSFDWGVKLLNVAVWWLYGQRLTDEATCYKVFPTSLLRAMSLECERFEFCPEVTAKACRLGARILELPISYAPRSYDEGKKIGWRDGVEAVRTLWRYRHWSPAVSTSEHPSSHRITTAERKEYVANLRIDEGEAEVTSAASFAHAIGANRVD